MHNAKYRFYDYPQVDYGLLNILIEIIRNKLSVEDDEILYYWDFSSSLTSSDLLQPSNTPPYMLYGFKLEDSVGIIFDSKEGIFRTWTSKEENLYYKLKCK